MQAIHQMFEKDHYARHSGIELVSIAPGKACARMAVQPWHLNGIGTVQGGALFTLADFAFAAASNSHGAIAVAINVSITFMKAVSAGTLTAHAEEVAINSKLGSYAVRITDEQHSLIAIFQGLAYRKKDAVPNLEPKNGS